MAKTKNEEVVKPKLDTLYDVVTDPKFTEFLSKRIDQIKKIRAERPLPQKGFKYGRDWVDKLEEINGVSTEFFLKNIADIWLKQSKLSSELRDVIKHICNEAYQETLSFYGIKIDTDGSVAAESKSQG